MKRVCRITIGMLLFVLSACGGNVAPSPVVTREPISISAHMNGDWQVVVDSNFSYTVQSKGLGNSWDSALAITNEDATKSSYTLYFLSQDEQDNVTQIYYEIGQPFNISFSQSDWVENITHQGQGNIIAAVRRQPTVKAQPYTPTPFSAIPPTPQTQPQSSNTIDPETFIRNYFSMLTSSRNYEYAWTLLTDSFKSRNVPGGYSYYVEIWDAVNSVEIHSISVYELSSTSAKCKVDVTFHDVGGPDHQVLKYHLIYDSSRQTWMFESP